MEWSSCQKIPSVEVSPLPLIWLQSLLSLLVLLPPHVELARLMSVILDVIVHITNGPIRNSDPRLRIVFFHGLNSNFDSEFEVLKKLVGTSKIGPILVFP